MIKIDDLGIISMMCKQKFLIIYKLVFHLWKFFHFCFNFWLFGVTLMKVSTHVKTGTVAQRQLNVNWLEYAVERQTSELGTMVEFFLVVPGHPRNLAVYGPALQTWPLTFDFQNLLGLSLDNRQVAHKILLKSVDYFLRYFQLKV